PVDERQILVDAFDAERAGLADRGQRDRPAVDENLPRIRLVITGQDLDQRRFAGAVVAENAERLAIGDMHRDAGQCDGVAERLLEHLGADRLGHQAPPGVRHRARWMLANIAMRIAAPMMILNMKALMPCSVKPSCKTPSMIPPTRPPTIVPAPPAIAVPPITPDATPRNMMLLPPASGSAEPTRKASSSPVKPPSVLVSTKLPTLMRLMRMPASAAAMTLPPIATVCSPQRVWRRTTCITATIARAQTISE